MNSVEIARSRSERRLPGDALVRRRAAARRARATAARTSTFNDLSATLGTGLLRIIAIDPQDPEPRAVPVSRRQRPVDRADHRRRHDRDQAGHGQRHLHLVRAAADAGRSWWRAWSTSRRARACSVRAIGAPTFERLPTPPSIRALSQRDGTVYAATDNFGDGYALGTSADEGTTWRPLMPYADVKAINPCLKAQCQATCQAEVDWACGRRRYARRRRRHDDGNRRRLRRGRHRGRGRSRRRRWLPSRSAAQRRRLQCLATLRARPRSRSRAR